LTWRDARGPRRDAPERIGGSIWEGIALILASPYLLAICAYVLLLTAVSTFLYFEQARIVAETFKDRASQTQAFSAIDAAVQGATILIQIVFTAKVARRLGVTALLSLVPLLMVAGFFALAAAPTFAVLVAAMFARRVGEYALVRPGREMLFAPLDAATKYKAKNVIDSFVYRGGDMISAWLSTAIAALGSLALVALAGAALAAVWAGVGAAIGRRYDRGA
jgi:AAA family ATP:ADP antiporter